MKVCLIAEVIKEVKKRQIANVSFLLALKRMEQIIKKVLKLHPHLDGVICPGHVAVITGANYFRFMTSDVTTVICGFQTEDILAGIYYIISHTNRFKNLYKRVVSDEGNRVALELLDEVFEVGSVSWRRIGVVKESGYHLKEEYFDLDAKKRFELRIRIIRL